MAGWAVLALAFPPTRREVAEIHPLYGRALGSICKTVGLRGRRASNYAKAELSYVRKSRTAPKKKVAA